MKNEKSFYILEKKSYLSVIFQKISSQTPPQKGSGKFSPLGGVRGG